MSETALSSLSCEIINDYPKMKIHHDKIIVNFFIPIHDNIDYRPIPKWDYGGA